jgi:ribosomal protein L7/L12
MYLVFLINLTRETFILGLKDAKRAVASAYAELRDWVVDGGKFGAAQ